MARDQAQIVLVVCQDHQILVQDRRNAAAARFHHERSEVTPPHLAAVQIQGEQDDLFGRCPRDDDALGVHGRRGRGVAVVPVLLVGSRRVFTLPQHTSVRRVEAQDDPFRRLRITAGHEDPLAPNHRRRMADAGQLDLPVVVPFGPFRGHGRSFADAAAVGAAETGPFTLGSPGRGSQGQDCGESD